VLQVFHLHDAGVIDQDVEGRILPGNLACESLQLSRVLHIQCRRPHTRVGCGYEIEHSLATAGNDHLISELVKGFGQCAPDARTAASDENSVACHLHECISLSLQNKLITVESST